MFQAVGSILVSRAAAVSLALPRLIPAQDAGGAVSGRNYAIDILIVLALFGAALYVVCRSSRRV